MKASGKLQSDLSLI